MSKHINICQICLRTDRKLIGVDSRLSEYHDELCDFSLNAVNPQYCAECGYMLKKLYNFKAKCAMAVEVFRNWKKMKASEKKPVDLLHTLLPPIALGPCKAINTKTYSYRHQESGLATDINVLELETSIRDSQLHVVVVPAESIVESQPFDGINQEFHENSLDNDDIKLEIDCNADLKALHLQDLLTLKTESASNFEEILLKNDNSHGDTEGGGKLQNVVDDNDDNLSSDSDNDSDNKVLCPVNNSDKQNKVYNKVKEKRRSPRKRTFTAIDISLHDDISDTRAKKISKGNSKKIVTKKKDSKRSAKIVKQDSIKKQRFHTKKDIIAELAYNIDAIDENCEKMKLKKGKPPFSKERLKAELVIKFASCGELKADDDIAIDKQFIISCLDDKVTEFVMRQLWNAVQGKSAIKPKALKLFKCIQNKYKNEYESVFDIEYLNTKEKMLQEFQKRKTYECYINAEYKCEMCYQGFKHEKKLEYHKKCHDESAGEFVCAICSVRQKHKKNLISHVNSHEAVYKCKLCPLVTYYKGSMVNHYQLHKGVKFRCEPCDVTFGSQSAYRTHVSYRHQRRHVCTACGRAFFTDTGLKWHTTRAHQDETPRADDASSAKCEQCDLTFPSQEVYLTHVRITHEAVTRGRPPGTTSTYNIQNPRLCRPRKKPVITCRVCNSVGSSIGWLNLHFRTEHPSTDMALMYADKQTHLCDVCGKGFTTKYTLRAHLNTHTGVRPYACAVCPKRFHRALSLRQHRLAHLPPGKSCGYCGKKFRSQSNLTNHVRFHIGDRRYKCKICGKGFLHRSTLNEHVRGVHHNVRRVRKRGVTEPGARGLAISADGD